MPNPVFIFIERLSLGSWFFSVLPCLIRSRRIQCCYYFDATRSGAQIAVWSASMLGVVIKKLEFRLVDIRDEEGLLVRLRIPNQDLAEVQAEVMKEPIIRDFFANGVGGKRLRSFVAKSMVTINFDQQTLWRALLIVHACVWKCRFESSKDFNAFLFVRRRPWFGVLHRYAARQGIELVATLPMALSVRGMALWHLRPRRVAFVRRVLERFYHIRFMFRGRLAYSDRKAMQGDNSCPRIAVEYSGHLNLSQPSYYSDLFFWQQSSLAGRDVLVTFAIPSNPLELSDWKDLCDHDISALALYSRATKVAEVPLFRARRPPNAHWNVGQESHGALTDLVKEWLSRQVEAYSVLRNYWSGLFESQNVRVFTTWYRFDATHCAVADAMESVGGITSVYQRALQMDASPEIAVDADIVFGYSPADVEVERLSGSTIPYHVAIGYFGDHRFPLLRERAGEVRRQLQLRGAKFIMAYFDENSGDDSRWHTGHEFMQENYAFLLQKVLLEPWFGLVIKPKRPSSLRRRLGPVRELLERAVGTGRCSLYDAGALHGDHPPVEAALAADVAVHGHLCAGTAGFEAALAGVPTLLLDREGWHRSALYELGVGRVVFTKWQELWEATVDHRRQPQGQPGYGDWMPMIDEFDPFRDGGGARRMGTYFQWLLDGFADGFDREKVLDDAAERYCERWGADKIHRVDGSDAPHVVLQPRRAPYYERTSIQ